jgi:hypothetical protein
MTSTSKCITVNDEYKPTPKGAKSFIKGTAVTTSGEERVREGERG